MSSGLTAVCGIPAAPSGNRILPACWLRTAALPRARRMGVGRDRRASGIRRRRHHVDSPVHRAFGTIFVRSDSANENLLSADGALDTTYCSVMTMALAEYLLRRSGRPVRAKGIRQLSPRQLRMTMDRIDHLLPQPIQIADLATPLGISEGHFYRAFRGAAGRTPVLAISERRVERAASLLAQTDCSVNRIALEVGLMSPSHLARLFRAVLGTTPSEYRREFRAVAVPARNDQDEAIRSG